MKTAFLFPGQGSQAIGMGKDLAEKYPIARQTFEEADEALGMKISQLCFEGPEDELRLTENTQPAILTASVAAWRVLEEKGIKPSIRCRAQPRRVFGARGRGDDEFRRRRPHRPQPRQVHAGSGSGGDRIDGGDSWECLRKKLRAFAAMPRKAKSANRRTSILPSRS